MLKKLSLSSFLIIFIIFIALTVPGCIQNQKTVKICEERPLEYGQRDQCFRQLALETKNTSVCALISDEILRNYWCYREIAYDTKNNSTCELIDDTDAKQSCYDVLSGKQKLERGR